MQLNFAWKDDGKFHQYCFSCYSETISVEIIGGRTQFRCSTCGKISDRAIVIDPSIKWWLDELRENWHEAAGVFVRRPDGRFLFFHRTVFPFVYTVPAGHVNVREAPSDAAARELAEEVGIQSQDLMKIATEDVPNDRCRRGADIHRWHAYLLVVDSMVEVEVLAEGDRVKWMTLTEALAEELIEPVRLVITRYADKLTGAA